MASSIGDIEQQPAYEMVATTHTHGASSSSGVVLGWTDVSYTVDNLKVSDDPTRSTKTETEKRTILNKMSGQALPGQILAIMGQSGAGKSTLLDVLSGRLESNNLHGTLSTNGVAVNKAIFRKQTGYVMQSDALFPLLTVRESIRYAAHLRCKNMSAAEKDAAAEEMITLLRLEKCADTRVGNEESRGISGGEKRRVSIAVDIVHKPSIIFLDEPTSGLDSTTALSVMEALKKIASDYNLTLVLTIHQPSTRIFNTIDRVIFLSAGHVTFFDEAPKLQSFANEFCKLLNIVPAGGNAPEMYLDLCDQLSAMGQIDKLFVGSDSVHSLHQLTSSSSIKLDTPSTVSQTGIPTEDLYANSPLGEMAILAKRAFTNVIRTPELFAARLVLIFVGFQMGTLFLFTANSAVGLSYRAAFFTFTLATFYWTSLEALPIFFNEREIFMREFSRGAYRGISYTLATWLVSFPVLIALATLYAIMTWWLVGLPQVADRFFFFVFQCFVALLAGQTFATMISTLVPDPMTGQTIGSTIFAIMLTFSGYFITRDDMPKYWVWLHYLSMFKWMLDSMLINAFTGGFATTSTLTNAEVLSQYSIQDTDKGVGLAVMVAFTIFFRIVFYTRLVTGFTGSRKG